MPLRSRQHSSPRCLRLVVPEDRHPRGDKSSTGRRTCKGTSGPGAASPQGGGSTLGAGSFWNL